MNAIISDKVFCKMVAHAAKYPHCTVNGVLLAKSSSNSKEVEFVDAIPLFHICVNLTPMTEIALMQIDEYASRNKLTISGYYVSPENAKDNSFEKNYNRIIDKIAANHPTNTSYVILVNSTVANIQMGNAALKAAQYADGSYKTCESPKISNDTLNLSTSILEDGEYERLVDFDNHLDNISLDWTNSEFNKLISV